MHSNVQFYFPKLDLHCITKYLFASDYISIKRHKIESKSRNYEDEKGRMLVVKPQLCQLERFNELFAESVVSFNPGGFTIGQSIFNSSFTFQLLLTKIAILTRLIDKE